MPPGYELPPGHLMCVAGAVVRLRSLYPPVYDCGSLPDRIRRRQWCCIREAKPMTRKLEWIPIRNLAYWDERRLFSPAGKKLVDLIAAAFRPEMCDPVVVTPPNDDGIHRICDGQVRVAVIRKLWGEEEKVPCFVSAIAAASDS